MYVFQDSHVLFLAFVGCSCVSRYLMISINSCPQTDVCMSKLCEATGGAMIIVSCLRMSYDSSVLLMKPV